MRRIASWLDRPDAQPRVAAFRAAFFGIVAVDAITAIAHASAYGAGDLNVSHLPFLDPWLPVPTPRAVVAALLLQAWLAARIAVGITRGRWEGVLLASSFAATYLWSQLDSWQHRWLVLLVLALLAGMRWQPLGSTWRLQVLRVQVAMLYVWTTIPKLHPAWLDGSLPRLWLRPGLPWLVAACERAGIGEDLLWRAVGGGTVVLELALVVGLLWRRTRVLAVFTGLSFHALVEAAGLEIGWFSWYMAALYVLFMPRAWFRPVGAGCAALPRGSAPTWLTLGVGGAIAAVVATRPVEGAGIAGAGIGFGTIALDGRPGETTGWWRVVALGLAGAWLLTATPVWVDHHRYLGGDAHRRGEARLSLRAYQRAAAADPADPVLWWKVARAAERVGDTDTARAAWRATVAGASDDPALWRALAERLREAGEADAARTADQRALRLAPDDEGAPTPGASRE